MPALLPGVPVIAEESVSRLAPQGPLGPSFILVDPLDGTREFLAGRDEFTVNIALIANGVPVAGVIAAPAQGLLWRGVVGGKAERLRLKPGAAPSEAAERSFIRARTGAGAPDGGDVAHASRCGDGGLSVAARRSTSAIRAARR